MKSVFLPGSVLLLLMAASAVLVLLLICGVGFAGLEFLKGRIPPPPVLPIEITSPQDPQFQRALDLSPLIGHKVILTHVPDNVSEVKVSFQIPMNDAGFYCDGAGTSAGGTYFPRDEVRGDRLYRVYTLRMLRGTASELYAGNVTIRFCKAQGGLAGFGDDLSKATYYIGFWYGPLQRLEQAAREKRGITSDSLMKVTLK